MKRTFIKLEMLYFSEKQRSISKPFNEAKTSNLPSFIALQLPAYSKWKHHSSTPNHQQARVIEKLIGPVNDKIGIKDLYLVKGKQIFIATDFVLTASLHFTAPL